MRTRLTGLALALALAACGGDAPTGTLELSVTLYDYEFDIATRQARSTLTVEVTEAGDCFSLPVRAEFVDALIDGKSPRSGVFANNTLELCGKGWDIGDTFELEATTVVAEETWEGTQVGYSITPDIGGNPFYYMVSWVGGCDRFGPCDVRASEFAQYRLTIAHDDSLTVLCPGTLTRDAGTTTCDFQSESAPTYSTFGFAASANWVASDMGEFDGVPVTFYDMPDSVTGPLIKPEIHDEFMRFMQQNFSPYPYSGELRLAVGPTVWNGFEHPGNVLLTDNLSTPLGNNLGYSDKATHVINHEIAHMWAGNRTTLASARDFVWKEATVEYLTYLFEDSAYPLVARRTPLAWKNFARGAEYYPVPDNPPPLVDFYGDAYGPGPLILYRQLEALFGREAIQAAVTEIISQPNALSIEDVEAILARHTEADLSGYFATWLHGDGEPEWPRFMVSHSGSPGMTTVTVTQAENPRGLFGCAFAVELRGANEGESMEVWFDLGVDGMAELSQSVMVDFEVQTVLLDPHGHALARIQVSSSAPEAPRVQPWVAPRFQR